MTVKEYFEEHGINFPVRVEQDYAEGNFPINSTITRRILLTKYSNRVMFFEKEQEVNEAVSSKYVKVFKVMIDKEPDYIRKVLIAIPKNHSESVWE